MLYLDGEWMMIAVTVAGLFSEGALLRSNPHQVVLGSQSYIPTHYLSHSLRF